MRHRPDSTSQPRYPSGWSIPAQLAVVRFFQKRKRRIRGDILVSGYGSRLLLCRFGVPRGCRYCRRPRRLGRATSAGWLPPHCKPGLIPSLKPFELPASVLRAAAPAGGRGTAGATRAGDQGAEIALPFHSPRVGDDVLSKAGAHFAVPPIATAAHPGRCPPRSAAHPPPSLTRPVAAPIVYCFFAAHPNP